jgi:signal recognition particle subunit SRP72
MPERKKVKKTKDADLQDIEGGGMIYIPKKRKRKTIYPKGFDPEAPGPLPDPERWLPKWQRSKYKRMAKKKGIYLKGAQGDAQVDTDVTKNPTMSTAGQATSSGNNTGGRNKRHKKR